MATRYAQVAIVEAEARLAQEAGFSPEAGASQERPLYGRSEDQAFAGRQKQEHLLLFRRG